LTFVINEDPAHGGEVLGCDFEAAQDFLEGLGGPAAEDMADQPAEPRPEYALPAGGGVVDVVPAPLLVADQALSLQALKDGEDRRVGSGLAIGHGGENVADAARPVLPEDGEDLEFEFRRFAAVIM